MKPNVLILTGYGINAEKELEWAFQLANGNTKIIHIQDLIDNSNILDNYQILGFPGGFSFGDHISSGKVFSNILKYKLMDQLINFIEKDKLIIAICNGFQIIVKLGLIPDVYNDYKQCATLIENDSGHFENRWVWVKNQSPDSHWLRDIDNLYLPVRHGEGKFIVKDNNVIDIMKNNNQIALQYYNPDDILNNNVKYPYNPNGSIENIAGITNKKGNILGLMPHPEAYIFNENHPRWSEGILEKFTGLKIFKNGVEYFK